jgi:hypothetical protein
MLHPELASQPGVEERPRKLRGRRDHRVDFRRNGFDLRQSHLSGHGSIVHRKHGAASDTGVCRSVIDRAGPALFRPIRARFAARARLGLFDHLLAGMVDALKEPCITNNSRLPCEAMQRPWAGHFPGRRTRRPKPDKRRPRDATLITSFRLSRPVAGRFLPWQLV